MEELIQRLVKQAGLTEEQARQSIQIIAGFTKEKFPMFGGAIDNLFKFKDKKDDFIDG